MDFHWWLKWTGLEKTRWLNDQSTPVLDDGRYRAALKGGLFQQREMFTEVDESGVIWSNGAKEEIDTLLFATGFRPNVSYLDKLKVIDSNQT
jgi:putative flavoprotein involved in K+ transport